jgi:CRISPR/Cas system CSM-associated protein Csm4 (group 5 of RAMP superfamily)
VENFEKKSKLSRRLQMFETNFLHDWESVFAEIKKKTVSIEERFTK